MLRAIIRFLSVISIALLLVVAVTTTVLNTQLITPSVNFIINQWIAPNATVGNVSYQAPNHFTFTNLTINNQEIRQVDAWLSLLPRQFHTPELDALLISGVDLKNGQYEQLPFRHWKIHQLSANDISLTEEAWSAQGVDIQWQSPVWSNDEILPQGQFQAYLPSVNWQNQEFKELLIRGELTPQDQILKAISFKWNKALIQARASKPVAKPSWIINELTTENLHINQSELSTTLLDKLHSFTPLIEQIERFDLIRGQIELNEIKFNNLQLSATNLMPNRSLLWQQRDSQISLTAEGIEENGLLWVEPNIRLSLNPNSIDIQDLNASLTEGDIYLSAHFQPQQAQIREFDIIGVRHTIESQLPTYPQLSGYFSKIDKLQIDKLSIHNSQIIQLATLPYWQLSGINLDLEHAQLLKDSQWGLWNGRLYASVNNLSYDKMLATQAILEMESDGKRWNLSRFFMPFNIGYATARGEWLYDSPGKPWKLDIETDSLPLKLFKRWPIPLKTRGQLDIKLTAHGLSGDEAILRHTLSGSFDGAIRKGTLVLPWQDAKVYQPFALERLHGEANNGFLAINRSVARGPGFNGILSGGLDLTKATKQQLTLAYQAENEWKTIDILNSAINEQSTDGN